MRSTVEVRVAVIHDVDQHENQLIVNGLHKLLAGSKGPDGIAPYERDMVRQMLESMERIALEAEKANEQAHASLVIDMVGA